jgi:hypothetical protein
VNTSLTRWLKHDSCWRRKQYWAWRGPSWARRQRPAVLTPSYEILKGIESTEHFGLLSHNASSSYLIIPPWSRTHLVIIQGSRFFNTYLHHYKCYHESLRKMNVTLNTATLVSPVPRGFRSPWVQTSRHWCGIYIINHFASVNNALKMRKLCKEQENMTCVRQRTLLYWGFGLCCPQIQSRGHGDRHVGIATSLSAYLVLVE